MRTLNDADVDAIATATAKKVRDGLKQELYNELGKSLLGFMGKCLIASLFTVAAYMGTKGLK